MPLSLTPNFPGSLDTALTLLTAVNSKETLLNGALDADANGNNGQPTIIDVVSTAGFPTQGLILIDAEVISYTGVTATSFTGITRAVDGTSAAIHVTLTLVKNGVIALYHNIMALMGIELERYHIEGNWLLLQSAAGIRLSGTQFTITGDWTSRIQLGDKVKFTDTTVKYSYISAAPSFGAGVTTITILDSILVGNPSLIYYSKSHSPQGFPSRKNIVQIVNAQYFNVASNAASLIPYDDTEPLITEGFEYMTLAITPKSLGNKLKIEVIVYCSDSLATDIIVPLFNTDIDATKALAVEDVYQGTATGRVNIKLEYYCTVPTLSPTTFRVRIGDSSNGTITFNGAGGVRFFGTSIKSSITITEIEG